MSLAGQRILLISVFVVLAAAIAAPHVIASGGDPGLWSTLVLEIQTAQRDLHRQLARAMQAVRIEGAAASVALIGLSFLYGIFHAAGPGHGKVVISTYILTHESQLRRGLMLSFAAALGQGLTAILAVSATVGLLGYTLRQAQGTTNGLETLSYGLVALLGFTLVASRVNRLLRRSRMPSAGPHEIALHPAGEDHRGHGDTCSSCGHAHGPTRRDLDAPLSWRAVFAVIASIGLRPCSGAVLVLLVAYSLDLHLAGIGAVLAMSVGTAITVSLLAVLSVYARKGALRIAAIIPDRSARLAVALDLFAAFGGLVILLAGILMLQAALSVPVHPLR